MTTIVITALCKSTFTFTLPLKGPFATMFVVSNCESSSDEVERCQAAANSHNLDCESTCKLLSSTQALVFVVKNRHCNWQSSVEVSLLAILPSTLVL